MGKRQMGKSYERRQQDKQTDREKIAYQKAERKGIRGLMNEVRQLQEEVALLDKLRAKDQTVIKHQAEYIKTLEVKARKAYYEGAAVAGFLVAVAAALVFIIWGDR
ncbi:hypothetical protein ACF5W4_11225 [Bacillota bacterium Lsc_1132]